MKFVKHSDKPIANQVVSNRGEMKTKNFGKNKIFYLNPFTDKKKCILKCKGKFLKMEWIDYQIKINL